MKAVEQLELEARQSIAQKDFQHGISLIGQAPGIAQTSQPLNLILIARLLNNLGFAYCELRDFQTAETYFRQYLASCLHALGEHLADTGNYPSARRNFEQALGMRENVLPANHPDVAENLANLGRLCAFTNDLPAAQSYLKRAIPLYVSELGKNHVEVQGLLSLLQRVEIQLTSSK